MHNLFRISNTFIIDWWCKSITQPEAISVAPPVYSASTNCSCTKNTINLISIATIWRERWSSWPLLHSSSLNPRESKLSQISLPNLNVMNAERSLDRLRLWTSMSSRRAMILMQLSLKFLHRQNQRKQHIRKITKSVFFVSKRQQILSRIYDICNQLIVSSSLSSITAQINKD